MPTSVLLAVLAAAGLLALAPALVRRYDATERLVAERALSTARVLAQAGAQHHRRRRTVPGRRPVNPPRVLARQVTGAAAFAAGAAVFVAAQAFASAAGSPSAVSAAASADHGAGAGAVPGGAGAVPGGAGAVPGGAARPARAAGAPGRRTARSRTVYRRRRTLLILVLLNLAEIAGAGYLSPIFVGAVSVTGFLLVAYVVHLRNRALVERRRKRAEARYAAWVVARQAAVRREQARRAAHRRELLERQLAAREEARRAELRGRAYESRAVSL